MHFNPVSAEWGICLKNCLFTSTLCRGDFCYDGASLSRSTRPQIQPFLGAISSRSCPKTRSQQWIFMHRTKMLWTKPFIWRLLTFFFKFPICVYKTIGSQYQWTSFSCSWADVAFRLNNIARYFRVNVSKATGDHITWGTFAILGNLHASISVRLNTCKVHIQTRSCYKVWGGWICIINFIILTLNCMIWGWSWYLHRAFACMWCRASKQRTLLLIRGKNVKCASVQGSFYIWPQWMKQRHREDVTFLPVAA